MSTYYVVFMLCLIFLNKLDTSNNPFSGGKPCNGYIYMKDISNCSWFYRCDISGRAQHLQCLPGLLFNEWINDCDHPYNVPECAEYPFFCRYFAFCWPPAIAPINSTEATKSNSSEITTTDPSYIITTNSSDITTNNSSKLIDFPQKL